MEGVGVMSTSDDDEMLMRTKAWLMYAAMCVYRPYGGGGVWRIWLRRQCEERRNGVKLWLITIVAVAWLIISQSVTMKRQYGNDNRSGCVMANNINSWQASSEK